MGLKDRITQGIREPIERATNLAIVGILLAVLALAMALVKR